MQCIKQKPFSHNLEIAAKQQQEQSILQFISRLLIDTKELDNLQALITAAQVLSSEEGPNGELVQDLIAFATSEAHSSLRQQLGISIES